MSASRAALRAFALVAFASAFVVAAPSYAVQRTFVSGKGVDANPCSLTLPCRTFVAAMAQTSEGGEIVVLDSAGYGGVDINKSLSISVPPGIYAGVTVTGPWGISITGATTRVALRGLTFNSQSGGQMGVSIAQGLSLTVEDCTFSGFSAVAVMLGATGSTALVRNTTIRDGSGAGISITTGVDAVLDSVRVLDTGSGAGIAIYDGGSAVVRNSVIRGNAVGIDVFVSMAASSRLVVEDSVIASNQTEGVRMHTSDPGARIEAALFRNTITHNAWKAVRASSNGGAGHLTVNDNLITRNAEEGIYSSVFGGGTLTVLASNNTVTFNSIGFLSGAGVTFRTRTNNTVENNATDTSGVITSITAH